MALLYLETNYLMGVATGRYPGVAALLPLVPPSVSLAVPAACVMEALAAGENERNRRNRFTTELGYQIAQLREGVHWPEVVRLVAVLDHARLGNDSLGNDLADRVAGEIDRLVTAARVIQTPAEVVRASRASPLADQPTDNLILHTILHDARARPGEQKAFFTANINDFRTAAGGPALVAAGVRRFFRTYQSTARWLGHLAASPPP